MESPIPIPDWLVPWVFGFAICVGGIYLLVAPTLTQRAIERHVVRDCTKKGSTPLAVCECVMDSIQSEGRLRATLFIASFGLSDSRSRAAVYSGSDNRFVQYIAREAQDRELRSGCGEQTSSGASSLSSEQKKAIDEENRRIDEAINNKRKLADELKAETARRVQEHKQRLKDAAKAAETAAENCDFSDSMLTDDAERVCKIKKEVDRWVDLGIDKSKQLNQQYRRKWRLPP